METLYIVIAEYSSILKSQKSSEMLRALPWYTFLTSIYYLQVLI